MDLVGLHTLGGLLSTITQMVAIIIVVVCAVNFFSLRPGSSLRFALFSLLYFFSSAIILSVVAQYLMNISGIFQGLGGIKALMGASVLHLFFGLVILAFYIRHIRS